MHRARGYTLIELIIVIGILGLAGALLVPVLGNRGDFDTQAAVRRLVADLMFAQSDALANQQHRRLIFLPDEVNEGQFTGWCIVRLDEGQLGDDFDASSAVYVQDPLAPKGSNGSYIINLVDDERFGQAFVASVDLDGGATYITFDELGGTVSSTGQPGTGGSIVLRGESSAYRIEVDGVTGKISIVNITFETPELETGGLEPVVP